MSHVQPMRCVSSSKNSSGHGNPEAPWHDTTGRALSSAGFGSGAECTWVVHAASLDTLAVVSTDPELSSGTTQGSVYATSGRHTGKPWHTTVAAILPSGARITRVSWRTPGASSQVQLKSSTLGTEQLLLVTAVGSGNVQPEVATIRWTDAAGRAHVLDPSA